TILVIDANNGQNALSQAKEFGESVNITGIIVTKLDGTAKGGIIIGIARELALPVYMIGIGEKVEDLRRFDPEQFVEALFS
ncbi:MAG TPA: signal recognition particle-docking protein FtsY, partial [bacterium]|nr:signal recognition particle-docking protein FtsY [bacterium]